jgi:hypothetical protein
VDFHSNPSINTAGQWWQSNIYYRISVTSGHRRRSMAIHRPRSFGALNLHNLGLALAELLFADN